MGLSDDLFKALSKVTEQAADGDPEFVDRAKARLDTLEEHERIAFEMSRFLAHQSVVLNDKRLHYASMAALFLSGILDEEDDIGDMSLVDFMDFADAGWTDIEEAIQAAINLMWEDGHVD